MYIDVHCHLDDKNYGSLDALIERCERAGVGRIITVGFDLPSSEAAMRLAERFPSVCFTAGFHPTELDCFRESDLKNIEELCRHEKCVALGEIGLDYHYEGYDKDKQRDVFLNQLRLAHSLMLPVQIHSRDCAEDMFKILSDNKNLLEYGALLHCYSHSSELATEFEKLGLYFSFGGASTWKGAKKAKRTIAALDESRLLTETDSPYMPPASAYGTFPNTPLAIPEILASIADIRGVNCEKMQETVWKNARKLFKKLK